MPTIQKYRNWCSTCNDWELFSYTGLLSEENKLLCDICGKEHQKTLLKDIPVDKIKEQRERYNEYQINQINDVFKMLQPGYSDRKFLQYMLSSAASPTIIEIKEADAGQKAIDDDNRKRRELELQKQRLLKAEREAELLKYKNIGRNDICICGSGKKYKKCCLQRIERY